MTDARMRELLSEEFGKAGRKLCLERDEISLRAMSRAREEALEDAAKVAETCVDNGGTEEMAVMAQSITYKIRALSTPEAGERGREVYEGQLQALQSRDNEIERLWGLIREVIAGDWTDAAYVAELPSRLAETGWFKRALPPGGSSTLHKEDKR